MARYLLDTNHAGTLLRDAGAPLWKRLANFSRSDCALCRPVAGELWFMIHNSARPDANRSRLEALLQQFDVYEFDARSAEEFGRLRAQLRRAGLPIPSFDLLIASIAIANDLTLLTADKHFAHISTLKKENWLISNRDSK